MIAPEPHVHSDELAETWLRHQMEIFSALLTLCDGNSPVTGELPSQRPVTWSFEVFFNLEFPQRDISYFFSDCASMSRTGILSFKNISD